jgi:hypothetical protein
LVKLGSQIVFASADIGDVGIWGTGAASYPAGSSRFVRICRCAIVTSLEVSQTAGISAVLEKNGYEREYEHCV